MYISFPRYFVSPRCKYSPQNFIPKYLQSVLLSDVMKHPQSMSFPQRVQVSHMYKTTGKTVVTVYGK
jgi:hypothetical protein